MTKFSVPIAVALSAGNAHAENTRPLKSSQVAVRADAPVLFAPRGWKIQHQTNGDLNRDRRADAGLVLVENGASKDTSRQRALVVLLREGKGWHRVGFNGTLLLGTRDGGAFYGAVETPVNVSIRSGVLVVNQESGSREVLETTHKFRLDGSGRMRLIGTDSRLRDRADGSGRIVSTNYLRGVRYTDRFTAQSSKPKRRTTRVSRKLRALDDVKGRE